MLSERVWGGAKFLAVSAAGLHTTAGSPTKAAQCGSTRSHNSSAANYGTRGENLAAGLVLPPLESIGNSIQEYSSDKNIPHFRAA